MKKEKWMEEVTATADTLGRTEAPAHLFSGIQSRLRGKVVQLPARTVWLAAASLAILVALNFVVLTQATQQTTSSTATSNSLTDNSFNLY